MQHQHIGKVVVLTGAGISAESGIRTFRDQNGLWENHRIEDVATLKVICAIQSRCSIFTTYVVKSCCRKT